jgi:RNA methyltransferase, TrmH family
MLSKQKVKYLQSLKSTKFRQKYGNFVVEGDKIAQETLNSKNFQIEHIIALETWIEAHSMLLKPHFNKILTATEADLKTISSLTTPNKVIVVAKQVPPQYDDILISQSFSLYLDGIQDPGNMGTIMRIADWFSIPYIFCSSSCVDIWNAKVLQASMGAFLRVKVIEVDFDTLKKRYPNLPIFASILRGANIFEQKFPKQGIIVIGNEGSGISENIIQQADHNITIPSDGNGAESLNAAVATGIIVSVLRYR